MLKGVGSFVETSKLWTFYLKIRITTFNSYSYRYKSIFFSS